MASESKEGDLDRAGLAEFVAGDPRLEALRSALAGSPAWLVGGSVRDLLLGRTPSDLDLVVEADPAGLATGFDPNAVFHERFMTATLTIEGRSVDIARARSERYPEPGALPEVEPASIELDLARRDFSINAIAVPLDRPAGCLDPFDGLGALAEGRLSLLHEASLIDDPTRALRGARYAARFGFHPDPGMKKALETVDLGSVSRERVEAELRRFAEEPDPAAALEIARQWCLVEIPAETVERVRVAIELVSEGAWKSFADRMELVLAACDPADPVAAFPEVPPKPRIEQFELIRRTPSETLVLARAAGREWLDWWPETGRAIDLAIDGEDLIEVGIEPGPAVGVGLRAALAEALEAGGTDRDRQLETAIQAARGVAGE